MGYWSKSMPGAYVVLTKEFDTTKADRFSDNMIKKTNGEEYLHNRYNYERDGRVDCQKVGKYGEEAFRVFLKEVCGKDMEVDYEEWEGSRNVDENDCFVNGYNIDVKFSRDNQNRGMFKCYDLNFMVPTTQKVKDITVWGFCDKDMKYFVIMSWTFKDYYMKNSVIKEYRGVKNHNMPLKKGQKITDLVDVLK